MKNSMKMLAFTILFFTISCVEKKQIANEFPKPKDVLVFIDKSASVSYKDAQVQAKAIKIVKDAVNKIENEGDRVSFLYLHKNTSSVMPENTYTVPTIDYPVGANTIEIQKTERAYYDNITKNKAAVYNTAINYFSVKNNLITQQGTDILGALEVISKLCRAECEKTIYLFTDAKQSTKGYQVNPKDKDEAESLAVEDSKRIPKDFKINPAVLSKTVVHFVLPYTGLNNTHDRNLTYYWQKLFSQFGATADFI